MLFCLILSSWIWQWGYKNEGYISKDFTWSAKHRISACEVRYIKGSWVFISDWLRSLLYLIPFLDCKLPLICDLHVFLPHNRYITKVSSLYPDKYSHWSLVQIFLICIIPVSLNFLQLCMCLNTVFMMFKIVPKLFAHARQVLLRSA